LQCSTLACGRGNENHRVKKNIISFQSAVEAEGNGMFMQSDMNIEYVNVGNMPLYRGSITLVYIAMYVSIQYP